jgi:hypothetical protein
MFGDGVYPRSGAIASFLEKGIEIGVASSRVAIPSALKKGEVREQRSEVSNKTKNSHLEGKKERDLVVPYNNTKESIGGSQFVGPGPCD